MRRLPPLVPLRAFEATARLGSVTRAAAELGRTHGAVSGQLRSLQEAAGFSFFEKAGTGLRVNAQGEALLRVVKEALDGLEREWVRLLDEARGPVVHVACSATFAIYPAADQVRAVPLGAAAFGPVCAPKYPVRRVARRLSAPTRIAHEYTGRAWDGWEEHSGLALSHQDELRFPHTHLCIEAAVAGLGVAVVEQRLAASEIAAERLIAPCGFTPFPEGWAAIPLSSRADAPAVSAFLTWVRTTLA